MVHPFLRRRQGLEPVTFPSADVEKALKRTLGVGVHRAARASCSHGEGRHVPSNSLLHKQLRLVRK